MSPRPVWLAFGALIALAGAGCTRYTTCNSWIDQGFKVGPEYCRPGAPLEPEWIDMRSDPRLVDETVDLSRWWTVLGDPALNEFIQIAYDQNLTVRQAGTRIQQAEAIRDIAVGNLFPQVQQAVGDFQRVQTSQNVAVPSPARRFSQVDLGVGAAWELDFWGRFRRSIEVADANLDASIADYDDVTVILLSDVAVTYVEIRTLQQRLAVTRTVLQLQRGSLEIARARFNAQQTNKLDVIQAQNNIDVTEAAIPLLESQLRIANNRLCVLLGIPPQDLVSSLPEAPIPSVSRFAQVGIPADLLRRRPDIRRAERLMQAQSARIGIAESELYPRISLIGSFEWQAEDIDDLFDASSVFALISPGFSWNILNYGRLVNGVELEQQRFRESVYTYQQTVLTAQREVEDGLVSFLKAQERADQLAQAVAQVNEAEQIALALYKSGATDFNRVFLIQAFQASQLDELVVSRANVALNLISIYRALGGGWEIRCPGGGRGMPMAFYQDQTDGGMIGEVPEYDDSDLGIEPSQPDAADQGETVEPLPAETPRDATDTDARLNELLKRDPPDAPSGDEMQTLDSQPDNQQRLDELLQSDDATESPNDSPRQRLDELLKSND